MYIGKVIGTVVSTVKISHLEGRTLLLVDQLDISQSDLRPLFGLGGYAGFFDVEVRMPDGSRWQWRGLPAGRLHPLELTAEREVATRR